MGKQGTAITAWEIKGIERNEEARRQELLFMYQLVSSCVLSLRVCGLVETAKSNSSSLKTESCVWGVALETLFKYWLFFPPNTLQSTSVSEI